MKVKQQEKGSRMSGHLATAPGQKWRLRKLKSKSKISVTESKAKEIEAADVVATQKEKSHKLAITVSRKTKKTKV